MDVYEFVNHIAFFLGAIVVCVSCMAYTLFQRNWNRPQSRIYIMMLIITFLTALCDIGSLYLTPYAPNSVLAGFLLETTNFLYFLFHDFLGIGMLYYALFATKNFRRITVVHHILFMLPFLTTEVLILSNPFTHMVWYLDDSYVFHRGWAEMIVYIAALIYYVLAVYMLLFHWYASTKKRRAILIIACIMTALGILIQFLDGKISVEIFAESITLVGVLLSVEYEDDRMDILTNVYNRLAYIQDMRFFLKSRNETNIISIQLTNLDVYQRMPDSVPIKDVMISMAKLLENVCPRYMIYRPSANSFSLVFHRKSMAYMEKLAETCSHILVADLPEVIGDDRIMGIVLYANVPDELQSISEVLLISDGSLPARVNGAVLSKEGLSEVFEQAEIERALLQGLEHNHFEVYYQLVYSATDRKIHSAEALIRLNSPEFGMLMPDQFIPVAERLGLVDQLGELVLAKVCDYWNTGHPDKLGLSYININLSVLQCMQPNFLHRVSTIVRNKDVHPSKIEFEITETVVASDYGRMREVMRACRDRGFLFSMEGYGTGYSNLYSVFSLRFDEIKLDRSLIWEADKSDFGKIVMANSIRMVHDLHTPVVAVGIETESQLERAIKMGVDMIQGFYLSHPMSEEDLRNLKN